MRERALSQIIEGNTIPTFVINKDHIVTHWNRAIEKLTGYKAEEIVGTNKQWLPFRPEKRPIMADVIVDEMEEEALQTAHDELEQKTAELERANIELKKFDEIKSTFLANMSHELRTPLNSVIGYTDLLLDRVDGDINEEQEKSLTKVHKNAKNLLKLINDVLDMSRIESGRVELDLRAIDLEEIIQETVSALEPLINKKRLIMQLERFLS